MHAVDDDMTFVSTTSAQVTRAVAIWVTALGAALFPLVGAQLFSWDDPRGLLLSLGMIAGGGCAWLWAVRRLDHLHRANRPYLMSERGIDTMGGRHEFARTVTWWKRALLMGFLLGGVLVILAISTVTCGTSTEGYCALPTASAGALDVLRWVVMSLGAAYIGAVVLGRAHEHETERMDAVIAEGRRRRVEGPIPGLTRSRWE